jgi:hypothetical protein
LIVAPTVWRRRIGAMHSEAVAIYEPTTDEWPYVVLVRRNGDYEAFIAKTHEEARTIAIARRQGLEEPRQSGKTEPRCNHESP